MGKVFFPKLYPTHEEKNTSPSISLIYFNPSFIYVFIHEITHLRIKKEEIRKIKFVKLLQNRCLFIDHEY